jgi:3-phosphoshikimate 1-carboxyvinyltransferase
MARIVEPLRLMGALIEATDGNFPPLTIRGRKLKAIDYTGPVASAQVKSCVLLAGLLAEGHTSFFEPALSRNHTELMLKEFGARIEVQASRRISIEGLHELKALDYRVPGDISSAAFFIAAAALLPGSGMKLNNVNLNPTRTGFLDILCELGARIERLNVREQHGETVGDLVVVTSQLTTPQRGLVLSGEVIPNIIDEIPIIAIVATQVEGRVEVRDAKELRIKESDRIRTVADGIKAIGGEIEEREDGFVISGPQKLVGGTVDSAGDHRIAMAFSIAGLIADGITEVVGADCASVSFPEFYESLDRVTSSDDAVQPSAGCDRMSPSSFTQHASAPVFLVGFMGAGKTTVGRALAEYLGYEFLDLDELIEARAGKSVQTIFAQSGEAVFRGLERKAIRDCVGHTRAVIALGGGAYASEENRSLLRKTGKTVWLDCPLEICLRRISGDVSRPLLGDEQQMRELHEARRGSYAQADIIVHTGEHSPDQLVREIAKSLDA